MPLELVDNVKGFLREDGRHTTWKLAKMGCRHTTVVNHFKSFLFTQKVGYHMNFPNGTRSHDLTLHLNISIDIEHHAVTRTVLFTELSPVMRSVVRTSTRVHDWYGWIREESQSPESHKAKSLPTKRYTLRLMELRGLDLLEIAFYELDR